MQVFEGFSFNCYKLLLLCLRNILAIPKIYATITLSKQKGVYMNKCYSTDGENFNLEDMGEVLDRINDDLHEDETPIGIRY